VATETEKKPVDQQAPAEGAPAKKEVQPPEEKPKPSGLDAVTTEDLKKLYARSPQMFEEAGIAKKEEKPPEKKPEPPPPAVSAAPKYGDVEIKLPTDVQVNRDAVDRYLVHAKEVGLSAEQVQKQLDWQTEQARKVQEAQRGTQQPQKVPTPAEQDAANAKALKEKWGEKYDENMERARQAAVKYAGTGMLERLKTSDPVLVQHFLSLAEKDGEDATRSAPNRSGDEGKPDVETNEDPAESHLKKRYNNSPTMFKPVVRG
jgi:hypothetical protein